MKILAQDDKIETGVTDAPSPTNTTSFQTLTVRCVGIIRVKSTMRYQLVSNLKDVAQDFAEILA